MDLLRTKGSRVFVATGYTYKARGKTLMDELVKRGLVITCDWTAPEHDVLRPEIKATLDAEGVLSANVLVVLMDAPNYDYKGTNFEAGVAYGAKIPVVMISPFKTAADAACSRNVHFHHKTFIRYETVESLLAAIDAA